ncbi:MAG: phospholipid carrier-dependent glycosyltransferase [bacterium]|nr:phospholipid carrier-dependent glycosyltransferase [bacterium]
MSGSAVDFERAGQGGPLRGAGPLGLCLLAAVFLALSIGSARQKSVTVDELGHLPSGVYMLAGGDVRHATLNPPLLNVLSALPVLALSLEDEIIAPEASDDVFTFWQSGYHFLESHRADYERIYDTARLVPIALVVGLGVLLFVWANRIAADARPAAGLLAASLLWFSPNVIAHARIVGTDTGTALFVALALFGLRALLLRPELKQSVLCGVVLGLAQLTKFYALLLYPLFVLLVIAWHRLGTEEAPPLRKLLISCATAFLVSLVVLNAGYGFAEFGHPLGDLTLHSGTLTAWQGGVVGSVPLPLPGAFVRAVDGQLVEVGSGIRSYLLGEAFQGGRWDYYLILLALKTPLVWLAAFGLAVAATFRTRVLPRRELVLLLAYPCLLFLVLSSSGNRQLGARALLSAVPFMALWMSAAWVHFWPPARRTLATGMLCALALGTSLLAYPDYLSYFNVLAGGRDGGYRHASDANIDIGQDLEALAQYLEETNSGPVQLLYFGSVDPALYGIDYRVPGDYRLSAGTLAISVSLYRMSYDVYDHGALRKVGPVDVSSLGDPVASIGGSIHIYRLTQPAG